KMSKSKQQSQTVADKVSKLLAHPNDSDSEDDSDIDVSTATRLVEFDDEYDLPDARSSDFRKHNVKLLSDQSERYKGKISSRKELEEEAVESDDEVAYEESDTDEEESATMEAFSKKLKAAKSAENEDQSDGSSLDEYQKGVAENGDDSEEDGLGDEEDDDGDEEDDDGDEEDDDEEGDDDDDDGSEDEAIDTSGLMSQSNQQAEIQKGVCVQNQLRVWERLLELRINTQKFTSKANLLPPPETLQAAKENNEELQSALAEAEGRSSKLLQQLLALQSALLQQNSEMRQSLKRPQPHASEENGEPSSKRFAKLLQSQFQDMRNHRNEVLLKWDDRTKLLTPGAGVKRKSLQEDYDILKKIDSSLANRQTLVEKSQTLKSNQQQQVEGEEAEQSQRNPNIYDDSDFYHQQLRELIEYKASTTSNMSEITKQFVELQKLRQKMKKKVDTRASKGRKLRYVVHNKLVNFMAPNDSTDWTEAKSELYKSLFV
ncbi:hypothetical protein KR093_001429, partial [Drosophila rubida]